MSWTEEILCRIYGHKWFVNVGRLTTTCGRCGKRAPFPGVNPIDEATKEK